MPVSGLRASAMGILKRDKEHVTRCFRLAQCERGSGG